MQKLLVASTMILGLFLAGCHDSSKEKIAEQRLKDRAGRSGSEVTAIKEPARLKARHRDFEISSKYTKCVKSGRSDCLLIREVGQEKWKATARTIEGFNYEPGYHYLVRVREKVDENNMPRWKLVKIMKRQLDK